MWNRSGYCFKPLEHPLCTTRRLYRICAVLVRLAYVLTGGIFRLSDTPQFKMVINSHLFRQHYSSNFTVHHTPTYIPCRWNKWDENRTVARNLNVRFVCRVPLLAMQLNYVRCHSGVAERKAREWNCNLIHLAFFSHCTFEANYCLFNWKSTYSSGMDVSPPYNRWQLTLIYWDARLTSNY